VRTPEIFLAHAPRGEGLRCALAYLSGERDVCGWFTGPRKDATIAGRFFLIENYYTNLPITYESVDTEDLHGAWSLDEARRHELAQMQEAFAHEWLQDTDVRAGWSGLQVRRDRLDRFSQLQPNWTHYSPGFARGVLRVLAKRWPLEYQAEGRGADAPRRRAAGERPHR
jgi:hypothetical protein